MLVYVLKFKIQIINEVKNVFCFIMNYIYIVYSIIFWVGVEEFLERALSNKKDYTFLLIYQLTFLMCRLL